MWGVEGKAPAQMVRRVSATQWETKVDAEFRRVRIAELRARLAQPSIAGPSYEACSECGTHGSLYLHRASCSKYSDADEEAARARAEDEEERAVSEGELRDREEEPTWMPIPETLVAAIETGYQRYLVNRAG